MFGKFPFDDAIIKTSLGDHLQKKAIDAFGHLLIAERGGVVKPDFEDARGFVIGDGGDSG